MNNMYAAENLETPTTDIDGPLSEEELLEEMVLAIVDYPQSVRIEVHDRGDAVSFVIHTDPRDCGKVIGKSGRTVDAIRTFLSVVAFQNKRRISVSMAGERERTGPNPFRGTRDKFRPNGYTTESPHNRKV